MKPPAVVLGGVGPALSMARSLSRNGAKVYVVGDAWSLVAASRHCDEFVDLGYEGDLQGRWLEWLEQGPRGAVVLPAGDDGLELVARNRARLDEWGYIPVEADDEVVLGMLDKFRTFELATAAGVPAPQSMVVEGPADAVAAAERIGFPCGLKPLHSHLYARHFDDKMLEAADLAELTALLERTAPHGLAMLATELIPGPDDSYHSYYTYMDASGEPLFHLTKRKLRQYPIHFGLGTYHVTDWNPEVAELGLRFCRGVGLRGLANVEFKRDARDGGLQLIECNHRFTAINELVRRAGIDLAAMTYELLLGNRPDAMPAYRTGARIWAPIEDFRAARDYRRAGELTWPRWLASVCHRSHPYFFDYRDPGPTLRSLGQKLRSRTPLGGTSEPAVSPSA